jgi:hypothetical protein
MTASDALLGALADLAVALDAVGRPAMIIGGIAAIARGVPRHTIDVDATVWAPHLDLDEVLRIFGEHRFVPRIPDAARFAEERQVVLLRHDPSGTPVDLALASLPFEHDALRRATPVRFGNVVLPVATAEDLVIYKAIAWRDRDRSDVERLVAAHGDSIDLARVRSLVAQFAAALDEPARIEEFDDLIRRVRGG